MSSGTVDRGRANVEVESRSFRIHYETWGDGPPLVLVSGALQWIDNWLEAGIPQHFSRNRRVIALDPLGHGKSDKPHDAVAYHEADLAADVIAVLDAERIDVTPLWGYSRGGRIAYLTTQGHRDRISALIVGGAAAWSAGEAGPRYGHLAAALDRSPDDLFNAIGVTDVEGRRNVVDHNDLKAAAAAMRGSGEAPVDIDLDAIRCPSLLYFGSVEPWADRARADAGRLGASLHVVAGKNHGETFLAGPEVIPVVEEFLARAESLFDDARYS
jgi:pimeloyl-ACP methyl ester carboxylesterase